MTLESVYTALLVCGAGYALLAALGGWISDVGMDTGGVDASGHLDAGHPHALSGITIATFVTGFAATGLAAGPLLGLGAAAGAALAVAAGFALATAAYVVLQLLFSCTGVGVERVLEELIGEIAEITTPIPARGLGEVVYVSRGQRELASARSISEEPVPRGSIVRIEDVAGTVLHVRRLDALD